MHHLYLDFNSTSPLAPSVREAMDPFWIEHFMLPGQGHPGCQIIADALDRAREGVAELIGCESFEVVFTSGGTEANNLGVLGLAHRFRQGHIVVSALEHESVWNAVNALREKGWSIDIAPANEAGLVLPSVIEPLLREDTRLVCLQLANPILGTLQPVRQVADICHSRGIPVHCDAAQVCGKMPLDVGMLRADTLAISGHKFYGPKGTGALFVRRGFSLSPVMYGETREMGLRPGSENIAGWIGLGAASRLAARCAFEACERMEMLRNRLVLRVRELVQPLPIDLCAESSRLPNTSTLEWPGDASRLIKSARQLVVQTARTASPADEMTRCLQAIGLSPARIGRCLRISLGWTTSEEQIDRAADQLAEAWDTCRT